MCKLIIAGGRDITSSEVWNQIDDYITRSQDSVDINYIIVSGGAKGVDTMGEGIAKHHNFPVHRFPADWKKFGKSAGPKRNMLMAIHADRLLLVWDGKSRGSASMKREMEKQGKPVDEIIVGG